MAGGFAPQGDLRAIHLKNPGIAARSAPAGGYAGAGQETKLHEAARVVPGEVNPIEDGDIPTAEIDESIVATQLHLQFSLRRLGMLCQSRAGTRDFGDLARILDAKC